jgi:hypothetical protein
MWVIVAVVGCHKAFVTADYKHVFQLSFVCILKPDNNFHYMYVYFEVSVMTFSFAL